MKSSFTTIKASVDLPVPAGPANSKCGMLRAWTKERTRLIISCWPTISSNLLGLYFSVQIFVSSTIFYKEGGRRYVINIIVEKGLLGSFSVESSFTLFLSDSFPLPFPTHLVFLFPAS